tara:strand:- start:214 stop:408 length:195 start_codon:yes stop_codon:yes gene_type:complete
MSKIFGHLKAGRFSMNEMDYRGFGQSPQVKSSQQLVAATGFGDSEHKAVGSWKLRNFNFSSWKI